MARASLSLLLLLLMVALWGCNSQSIKPTVPLTPTNPNTPSQQPNQPTTSVAGLVKVDISDIASVQPHARAEYIPALTSQAFDDISEKQLRLERPTVTAFVVGERGKGGKRYVNAVFPIINNTGKRLDNLTLVGAHVATAVEGTALANLKLADGSAVAAGVAPTILPTHGVQPNADSAQIEIVNSIANLQAFTESEVASMDKGTALHLLNYGFVVHNQSTGSRSLAPGERGYVNLGYAIPLQADASADPVRYRIWFKAMTDNNTRVTEGIGSLVKDTTANARADAINAEVALLGNSTTTIRNQRVIRLCHLRVAGAAGDAKAVYAFKENTGACAPNHAPTFVAGANQTILEDAGLQTVRGWATNMSDNDGDSQELRFSLTSNLELFDALNLYANTGDLLFQSKADANGLATVTVVLQDSGSVSNGEGNSSAAKTFTIDIIPVNDAPSFTVGANQAVAENAGAQLIDTWAQDIAAGPADEKAQTLSFAITDNSNPALFSQAPQVDATGALRYTPAANTTGIATIQLVLRDNGGTANGGQDSSAAQSFRIVVGDIPCSATVIYVNDDSKAVKPTGNSWASAFNNLQDALACATAGQQIWLAAGSYYPDEGTTQTDNARNSTFQLKDKVSIYGGFADDGSASQLSDAKPTQQRSILSGDLDKNDSGIPTGTNAYHVVTSINTSANTVLSGLVIRQGLANDTSNDTHSHGAGIYADNAATQLDNIVFSNNHANGDGGALYVKGSNATYQQLTFMDNQAGRGGAMLLEASSTLVISGGYFKNNSASNGGALHNLSSQLALRQSIFDSNQATELGGAVSNNHARSTFDRVTFVNNQHKGGGFAAKGGAMYNKSSTVILSNTSFVANKATGIIAEGGAMYNDDTKLTANNLTLMNNTAVNQGGALYSNSSSTVVISNSIFWFNEDEDGNVGIESQGSNSTLAYNYASHGFPTGAASSNIVNATSPFVDVNDPDGADNRFHTADDGLQLAASSAAIDSGNNAVSAKDKDILGNNRIVDGNKDGKATIDRGAYERP